jgi:Protein of unknown function (DUF2844)
MKRESILLCGAGRRHAVLSRYAIRAAAAIAVFTFALLPAWATLGQSEASVTSDQLHMKSEERVQTLENYRVHELTTAEGNTVREYVSPQGSVFAITWHGRSAPDMNQLLGTYTNNLQTATPAQTRIQRRRGISVKTDDFVYSNFCHLRTCSGSAYVPSLIPSNVSTEVIR